MSVLINRGERPRGPEAGLTSAQSPPVPMAIRVKCAHAHPTQQGPGPNGIAIERDTAPGGVEGDIQWPGCLVFSSHNYRAAAIPGHLCIGILQGPLDNLHMHVRTPVPAPSIRIPQGGPARLIPSPAKILRGV